jgi:Protein of unknown function (DUF3800)
MTHRLYIDEIGNSDLNGAAEDPNVRYLALTGVVAIRDHHDRIICGRMDDLKALLPGHSTDSPVLFHRREIIRREGPFAALWDPDIGPKFDAGLLTLFRECPYLAVTVQIDKRAHLDTYGVWHFDPYHYCLRCLIERYVLYLRRHRVMGDVVIEPRFKKADKKLKASFERIYLEGTENIPPRIVQAHLLSKDIGFYAKAANVAGLQVADLLAHPSARYMRFERDGEKQPEDFGGQIAQILVENRYARNPQTNQITGYGTKWLP